MAAITIFKRLKALNFRRSRLRCGEVCVEEARVKVIRPSRLGVDGNQLRLSACHLVLVATLEGRAYLIILRLRKYSEM